MKNLLTLFFGLVLTISFTTCEKAPPVFSIGYDGNLFEGEYISFESSNSTYDSYWNFGDGSFASGATSSHTYNTAGTYTVELTVTSEGKNYTSTEDIVIKPKPKKIKIKKVTIVNLDYQFNWDPQDFSGPDVYIKITQKINSNGVTSTLEHYTSSTEQNVTANSLPLIYTPNIEIPFDNSYGYINLYDEDGSSSQTITSGGSFDTFNDFPFTETNKDIRFLYTSTVARVEIEYIF